MLIFLHFEWELLFDWTAPFNNDGCCFRNYDRLLWWLCLETDAAMWFVCGLSVVELRDVQHHVATFTRSRLWVALKQAAKVFKSGNTTWFTTEFEAQFALHSKSSAPTCWYVAMYFMPKLSSAAALSSNIDSGQWSQCRLSARVTEISRSGAFKLPQHFL